MERHLHLVPAGTDFADEPSDDSAESIDTIGGGDGTVVSLDAERQKRRGRYHPAAGKAWLDELFDEDPLDPVC